MKYTAIVTCFLLLICLGCNKSKTDTGNIYCCGAPPLVTLLNKFKEDNKDCSCLAGIRDAKYNGESVIELYYYDPVCNTINQVYDRNGDLKFTSADGSYADYTEQRTGVKTRWTCKDGDQ